MNNQYFADERDYLKYSVIRHLLANEIDVAFHWMLTPGAGGRNPDKTSYLRDPEHRDRSFDPQVFDYLREQAIQLQQFNVSTMETGGPISACRFFSQAVPDDKSKRPEFLQRFLNTAGDVPLLFFDPDTGIEPRTTPTGAERKKFVLLSELHKAFQSGYSVLVYQHLSRIVRDRAFYLRQHVEDVAEALNTDLVFPFRAEEVGFVLVTQPEHDTDLQRAMDSAVDAWRNLRFWRPKL